MRALIAADELKKSKKMELDLIFFKLYFYLITANGKRYDAVVTSLVMYLQFVGELRF